MALTQDQLAAAVAAARPLVAALVGVGGTLGLYATANDGAIVQTIIAVATAAIPLGLLIWGYVAHRNQTALTATAAAHAFSLGSQDGVAPTAPTSSAAVNAAQVAITNAKAA